MIYSIQKGKAMVSNLGMRLPIYHHCPEYLHYGDKKTWICRFPYRSWRVHRIHWSERGLWILHRRWGRRWGDTWLDKCILVVYVRALGYEQHTLDDWLLVVDQISGAQHWFSANWWLAEHFYLRSILLLFKTDLFIFFTYSLSLIIHYFII